MSFFTRFSPLLIVTLPLAAQANTYCCEANGKTYCDDGVPAACYGKAFRELNRNGVIIKQYAAPLTPEQKAQKEAELVRQREEEERLAEKARQDRKLISMYATLSDMDIGHDRMLNDMKKSRQLIEQKLAETEKKKLQLANEAEFYKKDKLPHDLKMKIEGNEKDIETHKHAIEVRGQEIEAARLHFEEEKQRYMQLTAGTDRLR